MYISPVAELCLDQFMKAQGCAGLRAVECMERHGFKASRTSKCQDHLWCQLWGQRRIGKRVDFVLLFQQPHVPKSHHKRRARRSGLIVKSVNYVV